MAYRDRYNLEPLHIRAYLRSGVMADRWLPLDGILLYQAYRRQAGVQTTTIPGDSNTETALPPPIVPLGIIHPGWDNWYYQCSWAQWSHNVEGRDYWNKRFDSQFADLVDFGGKRGNIIIGSGQYKAYHMPIFYRAALWVEWYCVGDKAEIEQLLSTVTHLGKKSSQGFGRVIRWSIEKWAEDNSVLKDGQLIRGIPKEDVWELIKNTGNPIDFKIGNYGIRPSYWKSSNQKELAMPI